MFDIKIFELTVFRGQLKPWILRSWIHKMQRGLLGAVTFTATLRNEVFRKARKLNISKLKK